LKTNFQRVSDKRYTAVGLNVILIRFYRWFESNQVKSVDPYDLIL